ncbi:hypothetical protein QY890_09130 [Latilactobacillus sakei]
MDGYLLTDDGCYLFDYKTDFIDPSDQEAAIERVKTRYAWPD